MVGASSKGLIQVSADLSQPKKRTNTYAFAAERARKILASRELKILRPDEGVETLAVDLFEKFADQRISYTDCTSFVLMRQQRIERAFSFDRHFAFAGFTPWPEGS